MIYSVGCDKQQFKTIEFNPYFNVIIANRTQESSEKDTRNGLGKSTLLDIIHFLLGKSLSERLSRDQLKNWTFNLTMDLGKNKITVYRNTTNDKKVTVMGKLSGYPDDIERYKKKDVYEFSITQWKYILGYFQFGLDIKREKTYTPSYASLISYFCRRDGIKGGYDTPFEHMRRQNLYDIQINNSFLLNLAWEFPSKLHILKDKEKLLKEVKRGARTGLLSGILGTISELNSERIRMEDKAKKEANSLGEFKPLPQYQEFVKRSNGITSQIHNLLNSKKEYELLIDSYQNSLIDEKDVSPDLVTRMYREARFEIPEMVVAKLQEVQNFNEMIVKNRKEFLKGEMTRLNDLIELVNKQMAELVEERSRLNNLIKSSKSQDEYEQLIRMHQETLATIEDINNRIRNLKMFEEGKREIEKEMNLLVQNGNAELESREAQQTKAILTFNSYSQDLYDAPGALHIWFDEKGMQFKIEIQRDGSTGYDHMKVFCYDLMISKIWSDKDKKPGFLIHDSIIYDSVDERQKAIALELAAKESKNNGFQYICTLNSDSVPRGDFSSDFNFDKYVVLELTDASPEGTLLGFRY